jgi:hypothetical protein
LSKDLNDCLNERNISTFIKEGNQKELNQITKLYATWERLKNFVTDISEERFKSKGLNRQLHINELFDLRLTIDPAWRGLQNRLHPPDNLAIRLIKKVLKGVEL